MHRGDGSGPAGMGPMTGRGAGYCAGYGVPGYMNTYGGGFGGGFGGGRGRWGGYGGFGGARFGGYPAGLTHSYTNAFPAYSADQEKEALQNQIYFLEGQMTNIRSRIEELDKEDQTETE